MCIGICIDICVDMCVDMCVKMCVSLSIRRYDKFVAMYVDMRADVRLVLYTYGRYSHGLYSYGPSEALIDPRPIGPRTMEAPGPWRFFKMMLALPCSSVYGFAMPQ